VRPGPEEWHWLGVVADALDAAGARPGAPALARLGLVLEVAADVSGLALGEVLDAGERERARRARDVGAEPPAPVSFTGNSDAAPARDPRPSSTCARSTDSAPVRVGSADK
jgi:hypothetical protein